MFGTQVVSFKETTEIVLPGTPYKCLGITVYDTVLTTRQFSQATALTTVKPGMTYKCLGITV